MAEARRRPDRASRHRSAPFAWASPCLVALALLGGCGDDEAGSTRFTGERALTDGWQYRPDRSRQWRAVELPHVLDGSLAPSRFRGTVGWYRLRFDGPPGPAWSLRFDALRRRGRVWLNGRELARVASPYAPVTIAASGLRPGQPNELLIRVDGRRPAAAREGWWNWAGLVRGVWLQPRPAVALEDAALIPSVRCSRGACSAAVTLDGVVVNRGGGAAAPRLEVALRSPSGRETRATFDAGSVRPGRRVRVRRRIAVDQAELWSPSEPRLYASTVRLRDGGGALLAEQADDVGLRQVEVGADGRLRLNGRLLNVRGAGLEEDLPGRGPALRDADLDRIVADLKELNANVTRSHRLLHPALLDRFDREGILVWSQAAVYHADEQLKSAAGRRAALDVLRRSVLEARRHPSVLTHSVADELSADPDATPGTRAFLRAAARTVRDLDRSVPPSLDLLAYPSIPRQRAYADFPLLGLNHYFGWYKGKDGARSVRRFAALSPYLRAMRRRYPRQALAISEFGAEATRGGSGKRSYRFQADYLRRTLDVVDRTPFLAGAIYWTAREFAVAPRWDGLLKRERPGGDSLHHKGLLRYDGRPKPAWSVARERFARVPVLRP